MQRGTLDKNAVLVVKYPGIKYRCERKEYRFSFISESRSLGCKPRYIRRRESASGSELFGKVRNESGTAA